MSVTSEPSYRAAYDAGCAEIEEILERLALLRSRKEKMEKVIAALKLIVDPASVNEPSRPQPVPAPSAAQPAEPGSANRMQQHIDHVLRSLATA
jgi:hypothetical protein